MLRRHADLFAASLHVAFPFRPPAWSRTYTARHAGASPAQAILTGTRAAGTVMAIFFAAVSAYH
jgi:hypothetical protein